MGFAHSSWKSIAAAALFAAGCSSAPERTPQPTAQQGKPAVAVKRLTDRAANPDGVVLIVEYHKIAKQEARWDRSVEKFKKDLERFRALGFVPVTLGQVLDQKMDLPPGASPVVFTFDDGHPSQFRFLNNGGLIDPDCAIGIWRAFAEKHPEFPIRATFYPLPPFAFGSEEDEPQKLSMLKELGCEIGSHSFSHAHLNRLNDAQVQAELGKSAEWIEARGFSPDTIALPYGSSPKNRKLLEGYTWAGKKRAFRAALLVGAGPAPTPRSPKFDPMRLPRIQGIEGDYGITYWLDKVESGEVEPYVEP